MYKLWTSINNSISLKYNNENGIQERNGITIVMIMTLLSIMLRKTRKSCGKNYQILLSTFVTRISNNGYT